ncbi:hypothetical protein Tco_1342638, partial [Tanacetum coccineum]
ISNTKDISSTSGWVFLLGGAAGKEAKWSKNLLLEIPFWSKPIAPIFICCDSAATLAKAYSQMYNEKSRHLGVRHSMIRELVMNGVVTDEVDKLKDTSRGSNPSEDISSAEITSLKINVFILFAFDTFGFFAPEAVELLSRVQRVMHSNVMTPRSTDVVFKRIGFAIQKGLAAQLVARLPSTTM